MKCCSAGHRHEHTYGGNIDGRLIEKIGRSSEDPHIILVEAKHYAKVDGDFVTMSNRRLESIKPVLDAKLAEDTKEVVTDGNPTYLQLIPEQKHSRGNHGKELADRVWTTTQTVENAFSLFKRAIVGRVRLSFSSH